MRRFVRQNSLSLFFGVIFLAALVGQAFAGHADYNAQQVSDGLATVSLGRYLTSSSYAVDVAENWQSEYLQFLLYILATVWLLQRGSPESKSLDEAGLESDEEQKVGRYAQDSSPAPVVRGGLSAGLYSNSLGLVMGTIFLASWAVQSLAGRIAYNEQQLAQLEAPSPGANTLSPLISGTGRCRIGSPSSWPWARWRYSPSTCASEVHRNRSRSAPRTPRRGLKAEPSESAKLLAMQYVPECDRASIGPFRELSGYRARRSSIRG